MLIEMLLLYLKFGLTFRNPPEELFCVWTRFGSISQKKVHRSWVRVVFTGIISSRNLEHSKDHLRHKLEAFPTMLNDINERLRCQNFSPFSHLHSPSNNTAIIN